MRKSNDPVLPFSPRTPGSPLGPRGPEKRVRLLFKYLGKHLVIQYCKISTIGKMCCVLVREHAYTEFGKNIIEDFTPPESRK